MFFDIKAFDEYDIMEILVLCIAFGASIVGAICGIGGGVIIKPLLDAFGIASVAEISFLSGCTVLSMSCYSVVKALAAKESLVKFRTGPPSPLVPPLAEFWEKTCSPCSGLWLHSRSGSAVIRQYVLLL